MENKDQNELYKNNELYKAVDKIAREVLLLYAVMESDGDLINEPCLINVRKYNNFNKAIKVLLDLKAKGKCDFEAMDIRNILCILYISHGI